MDLPPFLVGPTGVGKTAIGVELARALGAEVLSIDSRQAYRRLDIATAKPTPAERGAARHHLLDLFEPTEVASAAAFAIRFCEALAEIRARGARALAVGGSGLYVDACLGRLDRLPPADPELRAALDRETADRLHAMLREVDPATAARLSSADRQRVTRALEVERLTGAPLSRLHTRPGVLDVSAGPPFFVLVRDRTDLQERIARRAHAMLADGVLEELAAVIASGVPADAPGLQAIGCGDLLRHLRGEISREAAVEAFVRRTRQYAKRQGTWFRNRYRGAVAIEIGPDEPPAATAGRIRERLETPLTSPPGEA